MPISKFPGDMRSTKLNFLATVLTLGLKAKTFDTLRLLSESFGGNCTRVPRLTAVRADRANFRAICRGYCADSPGVEVGQVCSAGHFGFVQQFQVLNYYLKYHFGSKLFLLSPDFNFEVRSNFISTVFNVLYTSIFFHLSKTWVRMHMNYLHLLCLSFSGVHITSFFSSYKPKHTDPACVTSTDCARAFTLSKDDLNGLNLRYGSYTLASA